jgi:hypothetical protein
VVKLESEQWETKYGQRPKPLFKVVDWKLPSGAAVQQQVGPRDDMDDEIPF